LPVRKRLITLRLKIHLMEDTQSLTTLIGIGSLILSVIVLLVFLGMAKNIKKIKNYSYMQVRILSELAKKEDIKIDLNELIYDAEAKG